MPVSARPPPQNAVPKAAAARGPIVSIPLPSVATDSPKTTHVVLKIGTMSASAQSALLDAITPSSRCSGPLKIDHAYSEPTESCTATTGGSAIQRLKPSGAIDASGRRKPGRKYRHDRLPRRVEWQPRRVERGRRN